MEKIILGIVQTILCPQFAADANHHHVTHTAEVLYRKIMAMPLLLRLAMSVLLYVFNGYGVLLGGHLFENHVPQNKAKQLSQWQNSPIAPCREAMSFFYKMTFFIYFSLCPKID